MLFGNLALLSIFDQNSVFFLTAALIYFSIFTRTQTELKPFKTSTLNRFRDSRGDTPAGSHDLQNSCGWTAMHLP